MKSRKYALISGANGGIGEALCSTFEEAGYSVIALDIHQSPKEKLKFTHYLSIDLNKFSLDESYADNNIDLIMGFLNDGILYCLINNAAVQILGSVDTLSRDDWQRTLNVNLQAAFLLSQAFIKKLEEAKGSIVNISSIHAKLTKKNFVAYATSKAALSGMTRAMAVDLGPRVRVNAIEPAAIETEMLVEGFRANLSDMKKLKECHPSGILGRPLDIAMMALFITNDKQQFLNGSCISVSGGVHGKLHDIS